MGQAVVARVADSQNINYHSLVRPKSNYEFIEKYFQDSWSLKRIMSQVRMRKGKSVVVEQIEMQVTYWKKTKR